MLVCQLAKLEGDKGDTSPDVLGTKQAPVALPVLEGFALDSTVPLQA